MIFILRTVTVAVIQLMMEENINRFDKDEAHIRDIQKSFVKSDLLLFKYLDLFQKMLVLEQLLCYGK